eukprot:2079454-Pyramimonas_sp.AAC.1
MCRASAPRSSTPGLSGFGAEEQLERLFQDATVERARDLQSQSMWRDHSRSQCPPIRPQTSRVP